MSQHTTILAFDSSVQGGSVCLMHAGVVYSATLSVAESQASQLVSLIEAQLEAAGIWYDAVTDLAVTVGPGSFTGIRIALAVARTIHFSYPAMRCHGFTTLECLAAGVEHAPLTYVTLRAGKGEIYYQPFRGLIAQADIELIRPEALPVIEVGAVVVGNTQALLSVAVQSSEFPQASAMATALQNGFIPEARGLKPLYIRPPDAIVPTKAQI